MIKYSEVRFILSLSLSLRLSFAFEFEYTWKQALIIAI